MRTRCDWAGDDLPMIAYHDREWGVPLFDDRRLFELLVLEGAQAGLSWRTILHKRPGYREAFDHFDPAQVAAFDAARVEGLIQNPAIVRNRLKIQSAVRNARHFLDLQARHGTFHSFLWSFVGGTPIINHWQRSAEVPVSTPAAAALSRALKEAGMNFVGPTICYAYMQSAGLVNDHLVSCFRHEALAAT